MIMGVWEIPFAFPASARAGWMDRGSCQAIIDERRETCLASYSVPQFERREMGRRCGISGQVESFGRQSICFQKFEMRCH